MVEIEELHFIDFQVKNYDYVGNLEETDLNEVFNLRIDYVVRIESILLDVIDKEVDY